MTTAKRNKDWGREVENMALRAMRRLWPTLVRSGSIGYVAGHADLWVPGAESSTALPLVVTKVKGQSEQMLVTLSLEDFLVVCEGTTGLRDRGAVVQVKGRSRPIYTHTVYKELRSWMQSQQSGTP